MRTPSVDTLVSLAAQNAWCDLYAVLGHGQCSSSCRQLDNACMAVDGATNMAWVSAVLLPAGWLLSRQTC